MPDSWRFAHQMTTVLAQRLEFLAWAGRADAFDTYFLRQAEAILRPPGLTELIGGAAPAGGWRDHDRFGRSPGAVLHQEQGDRHRGAARARRMPRGGQSPSGADLSA